jgi:dihydrofolate reductase
MRALHVFESISLDGFYRDANGGMQWAHASSDDPEFQNFVAGNAQGGGDLLFGRVTYEMMRAYWPTEAAKQAMPAVADGMTRATKYVASRTLTELGWQNTRLLDGELIAAVRTLKASPGPTITILGSGNIVAQLAAERLVDRYQLVVVPVILGSGATLFDRVREPQTMRLVDSRAFGNGRVVDTYASVA